MHAARGLLVCEHRRIDRVVARVTEACGRERARRLIDEDGRFDGLTGGWAQRRLEVLVVRHSQLLEIRAARPCVEVEHRKRDERFSRQHDGQVHLVARVRRLVRRLSCIHAVALRVHRLAVARAAPCVAHDSLHRAECRIAARVGARSSCTRAARVNAQRRFRVAPEVDSREAAAQPVERCLVGLVA